MLIVLTRVYIAVTKHHDQNASSGRRAYLAYISPYHYSLLKEGSQ